MEQVKINPGSFKEVITFLKRSEIRTPTGAVNTNYLLDGKGWAKITTKPTVESIDTSISPMISIEIVCYQRPLDTSYLIERKGKRYDIASVKEIGSDYLSIIAKELSNGAH